MNKLTHKQVGNIGEAKILAKLIEFQIPTYVQYGDNEKADYIIIVNNKCLKCQVKTSFGTNEHCGFMLMHNNWLSHRKFLYSLDEVDIFLLYDATNDEYFIIKKIQVK